MIAAWAYEAGLADLEGKIAAIDRRWSRGRVRDGDLEERDELVIALAELRAYYRADRRIELELLADGIAEPLDVALIQVEELLADNLTLRTIPSSTRDALKRDREAEYAILLYGLAGSGVGTP